MTVHLNPTSQQNAASAARMAELVADYDWSKTALAAREAWPASLSVAVDIVLGSGRAMCLAWGPDRIFLYNDAFIPFLGARHPQALGMTFAEVWPDVWPDVAPLVERVFAGETVTFEDMPLVMKRNGYPEDTWWSFSYSPVHGEDGNVAGLLNVASETTERMRAEGRRDAALSGLESSEAFMRSVLASSTDCIKVLDLDAKLVFMSEGGQRAMEISDFNQIAGCPWPDFWVGAGNHAAKEAVVEARSGRVANFQGYADTFNGNSRYWDVRVSPIFGPDGTPERILSVSRDISALKAAEEARTVLMNEMAHRMKNTLAIVQAVVTQTLRQTSSMEEGRTAISQRLAALGRAQDILTRSNFTEADVEDVVTTAVAPHQVAEKRIGWTGPHVALTAQQALGLSLAIHELATNAIKYGALSNECGRVAMSWGISDGTFRFEWIEMGGPAVRPPDSRGFGSKLMERIVAAYFDGVGRIDFNPAGIRFTLTGAATGAAPQA